VKRVFEVPERGDVVRVTFPTARDGSAKERCLAVILSPQAYNDRVGLALLCPLSANVKGYPFEVLVPPGLSIAGAVLADQAVCLDWRTHRAEKLSSLPPAVVEEILGKLRALLQ
jgi:mRNA interferase MazF